MTVAACVILGALAWLVLGVLLGSGVCSARSRPVLPAQSARDLWTEETLTVEVPPPAAPELEREPECDMRWN